MRHYLKFRKLGPPGFVPLGIVNGVLGRDDNYPYTGEEVFVRDDHLEELQSAIENRWQDGDLKGVPSNLCDPEWRPRLGESEWQTLERKFAWEFMWNDSADRENDGYYCDVKACRCDNYHTEAKDLNRLVISEAFLREIYSELHLDFPIGFRECTIIERKDRDAAYAAEARLSYPQAVQSVLPILFGKDWVGLASEQEEVVLAIGISHPDFPRFLLMSRQREEQIARAERWLRVNGLIEEWRGHRFVLKARLEKRLLEEREQNPAREVARASKTPSSKEMYPQSSEDCGATIDETTDTIQQEFKPPIPKNKLNKYLAALRSNLRKQGEPPPACDKLLPEIQAKFPNYKTTRVDLRTVFGEVFGSLKPGKRPKSAVARKTAQ